jgi:YhcH/YjgK/YiaL family protein
MIIDKIENVSQYYGLGSKIKVALEYLHNTDFSVMQKGRYDVMGNDVFALVVESSTSPFGAENEWESHIEYIDVHFVVEGVEVIGYANIKDLNLTTVCEGEDGILYTGEGNHIKLTKGMFLFVGPEDGHMPLLCDKAPGELKKVVMKIRVK